MKRIATTGLILSIAMSPLFRGLFFALETSIFYTAIALFSFIYLVIKIRNGESVLINKPIVISASILLLAYALSFVNAAYARGNIDSILQCLIHIVVIIVLYDYFTGKKEEFFNDISVVVVTGGLVNAVVGIEAITGFLKGFNTTFLFGRIGATFQYANTAAIYFAICILLLLSRLNTIRKKWVKAAISGVGSIILLAMLLTGSRGGFIVGFPIFLLFFLLQAKGRKVVCMCQFLCMLVPPLIINNRVFALSGTNDYISLALLLLLAFVFAVVLSILYEAIKSINSKLKPQTRAAIYISLFIIAVIAVFTSGIITRIMPQKLLLRFTQLNIRDVSVINRIEYNISALRLIKDNWLFGLGGGGWTSLYQSVQSKDYIARSVHNNYLQVFVEAGILGFLSYCAVIIVSLYYWIKAWKKNGDTAQRAMIAGLFTALLSLLIHSSFDFDLSFLSITLLLWVLMIGSAIFSSGTNETEISMKKSELMIKSRTMKMVFMIICSALIAINGTYSLSAYYADKGQKLMDTGNLAASRTYYEKAAEIDPINSEYSFELTKLYNYFYDKSEKSNDKEFWAGKARETAEKSVRLNNYYPAYTELLVRTYLRCGLYPEAVSNVEKLVKYQPMHESNYVLLARCYVEAGDYYLMKEDFEEGKRLLLLCTEIEEKYTKVVNNAIKAYKKRSIELLEQYF